MSPGSESPGVSGVLSNTRDADLLIDDNHAIASDLQHHVEVPMQLGQLEQALNMLSMSTMRPDPLPNGVDRPLSLSYSPLTRENFTKAYFQQWIPKHPVDQTMLKVEGCEIDLYQLHYEVMSQNGYLIRSQHTAPKQPFQFVPTLVISQEQWPVIAGRLGFVNFPAYGHEPARSGPGIAVHIERAYKQCLQDFDSLYLCHLFQWRRLRTLEQKVNGGDMSAGPSGPADPKGLSDIKDPKALNEIISYAALSAPELQARGVPDHIIALVEKHRDQLKATLQQQRDFANIQIAAQGQPRNVSNPAMANANAMLHHQANSMNMANGMNGHAKPPMQPGQLPQGMSMPSTSSMPPNGQQQQQGQQRPGGAPGMLPISTGRPTPAQMAAAVEMVRRLKEENKHVQFPTTRPVHIGDAQRLEYNAQFEHLHRLVTTLDQKLPHLAVCMREDVIKKLVMMISVVQQQREMLSSNPTQYFMPLQWVQQMIMQVNQANHAFTTWVNNAMRSGPPADGSQAQAGPSTHSQPGPSNGPQRQGPLPVPRPPTAQPAPTPSALSPAGAPAHTPAASASSPHVVSTPSISKKPTPKPSGDVASAPTPTHINSPQTPRSPRNKPAPKPKAQPKQRKVSTKSGAAASPAAGPSETKLPATPAAATPANAPTPEPSSGSKRPREEEPVASTSASAPPSAKKEWDEAPSDILVKRQAEADGAKTDEDTVKFLEQMSSWLTQIGGEGDGQDILKTEIAEVTAGASDKQRER